MSIRWFFLVLLVGIYLIILEIEAAPPNPDWIIGANGCLRTRCDKNSGPVCCIDASGVIRTFENKCMAEIAYCRFGTYYAVVKQGEC